MGSWLPEQMLLRANLPLLCARARPTQEHRQQPIRTRSRGQDGPPGVSGPCGPSQALSCVEWGKQPLPPSPGCCEDQRDDSGKELEVIKLWSAVGGAGEEKQAGALSAESTLSPFPQYYYTPPTRGLVRAGRSDGSCTAGRRGFRGTYVP